MFVVGLTQSFRSALLTLFPTTLISLLSWAFAGSQYANTSDPIRAGAWIFLGAHKVPMDLNVPPSGAVGLISYLPLGALLIPFFALVSGARKVAEKSDYSSVARNVFIFGYSAIVGLIAFLSANKDVSPKWYYAIGFSLLIAISAQVYASGAIKYTASVTLMLKIWALLFGVTALAITGSLIAHQTTANHIFTVLEPGIIGGIFLSLLNVLYIPNYLISALSYFVGTGFGLGNETVVAPLTYKLGEVPPIPILASVPTGRHPLLLISAFVIVIIGAMLVIWADNGSILLLRQSLILFSITAFLFSYLGSGALITSQLGAIGPSVWKFPLALIGELLIGVIFMKLLPLVTNRRG